MKKLLILSILAFGFALQSNAQYFRGKLVVDNTGSPTRLRFFIQPNPGGGNIANVLWDRFEMFVRRPNGGTAPTFGDITVNTTDFPGLIMQKGGLGASFENGWGDEPGFTIYYFPSSVPNNATSSARSYNEGQEYEVFNVTVTAGSTSDLEFCADQNEQVPYYLTLSRNTSGIGGAADMTATGPLAGAAAATNNVYYGTGLTAFPAVKKYYQKPGLLPVKFLSFFAVRNGEDARLTWNVENDQLNKSFDIERSFDGRNFVQVNKVTALGNGRSQNSYEATDARITNLGKKAVYYRIKQTDINGEFVYSPIRTLNIDARGASVSLFPNPVRDLTKLVIDANGEGKASIVIRDASGKQVQMINTRLVKGMNQQDLNLGRLPGGSYTVTVLGGDLNETIKFTKIN